MTSMCRMVEEVREEERILMISALLAGNSEEELLHSARFRRLHITQDEIDEAKSWDMDEEDDEDEEEDGE